MNSRNKSCRYHKESKNIISYYQISNGENTYVTTLERVQEEGFDRLSITAPGMPRLTDENVSYDKTLTKLETYDDGIVTEKGYEAAKNKKLRSLIAAQFLWSFYIQAGSQKQVSAGYRVSK